MKLYHYHKHDDKGRPVISVCIVKDTAPDGRTVYSRGMAICSPLDYGCLRNKHGKMIARGRALAAANDQRSRGYINEYGGRDFVIEQFNAANASNLLLSNYPQKSTYDIALTIDEYELIQKVDKNAAARAARYIPLAPALLPNYGG